MHDPRDTRLDASEPPDTDAAPAVDRPRPRGRPGSRDPPPRHRELRVLHAHGPGVAGHGRGALRSAHRPRGSRPRRWPAHRACHRPGAQPLQAATTRPSVHAGRRTGAGGARGISLGRGRLPRHPARATRRAGGSARDRRVASARVSCPGRERRWQPRRGHRPRGGTPACRTMPRGPRCGSAFLHDQRRRARSRGGARGDRRRGTQSRGHLLRHACRARVPAPLSAAHTQRGARRRGAAGARTGLRARAKSRCCARPALCSLRGRHSVRCPVRLATCAARAVAPVARDRAAPRAIPRSGHRRRSGRGTDGCSRRRRGAPLCLHAPARGDAPAHARRGE